MGRRGREGEGGGGRGGEEREDEADFFSIGDLRCLMWKGLFYQFNGLQLLVSPLLSILLFLLPKFPFMHHLLLFSL